MATDLSNLFADRKTLNPLGAALWQSNPAPAPVAQQAPERPTGYGDRLQSKIDELSAKNTPQPLPTFDVPSPTAPRKIGAVAPNAVEDFTSALSKGDFTVSPATPAVTDYSAPAEPSIIDTASASENAPDDLVQSYLNDESYDLDARKSLLNDIQQGKVDPKEFENYLKSQGYQPNKPEEPGFWDNLDAKAKERFNKALDVAGSDQSRFSQVLQTGGQAAGFVGDIFGEALVSAYKTAGEPGKEKAKELLKTDAGQAALGAISKGVEAWNGFKAENPETAGDIEAVVNIGSLLPIGKGAKYLGEGAVEGAETVGKGIVKGAGKTAEAIADVAKPVTSMYDTAVTGLSKAERAGLKANPFQKEEFDLMDAAAKSESGIDDVKNYKADRIQSVADEVEAKLDEIEKTHGDTGKVYDAVRKSDDTVPYGEVLSDFEKTLEKNGLSVKEWKVVREPGTKSGEINESDISKIDRLYQDILADAAKSGNDTITANQILDARHSASQLAKYDAASTSRGQYVVMQLRSDIDRAAKKHVNGLKELDAQYSDKLAELKDATKDLVYKQWPDKGTIRSNFNQIIATLDKPNRAKLLGRLEEIMPGIGDRVSAINNLPKLYAKANEVPGKLTAVWGATVWATTLGSVIPGLGHAVGAALGYALGNALETTIGAFRAKAIRKVLAETSEAGKKRLEEIGKKIAENAELAEKDKQFLESVKGKIENVEQGKISVPNRKPPVSIKAEIEKSNIKSNLPENASKQPLRNDSADIVGASIAKPADKTLKWGFLNRGGYAKLPDMEISKVQKLNTGKDITLVRWTGKQMDEATAAYSQAYGDGTYLSDDVKIADYYWPKREYVTIKNSDLFDAENDFLKPSEIKSVISEAEKMTWRSMSPVSQKTTYDKLRRDIYGELGLDDQEVSKLINSVLKKRGLKWIRYDIGRVNDDLKWNAFVIFK